MLSIWTTAHQRQFGQVKRLGTRRPARPGSPCGPPGGDGRC
jgi:hypothetical protein